MSKIPYTNKDPSDYYNKIGLIAKEVNEQDIILDENEIKNIKVRISILDEVINSQTSWKELQKKYAKESKINYTNCHNAILRHSHAYPLRSLGETYSMGNFKFVYYHNDELLREAYSGESGIVWGLSTGRPKEGTMYIGNAYQRYLSKENLPLEDFLNLGKALYKYREDMDIPSWELNVYGANGIIPSSSVEIGKTNTLTDDPKYVQYDMNNAMLWCVSKGILSREGEYPVNIHIDFKSFPKKTALWSIDNPNAKLNTSNDLTKHVNKILDLSEEMSDSVKHAFRKTFTVLMVIAIKTKNPPLFDNIICTLLTKLKLVADESNVSIHGINVDCIEVNGDIDKEFIGNNPGEFKKVERNKSI